MNLIDGRFRIDATILGSPTDGLLHATDDAGCGYLVTVLPHYPPRLDEVLRSGRFDGPGVAPVAFAKADVDGLDIVVEHEPAGRSSRLASPLPPSAARSAALELVRRVNAGLSIGHGLPPELVYLDGGKLAGVAPRLFALRACVSQTLTWGYSWFSPYAPPTRERRPTRHDDAYAIGMVLRYWLTGAPPLANVYEHERESPMQFLVDLAQGTLLFRYDGPLHEVIDGLVAGDLSRATKLLIAAKVDRAAEAMRARLVAEVVAHPEDDGPRLVLADWLLEQGDPRGELIQVQCRHASAPAGALAARANQLIAEHGVRWSSHLLPDAGRPVFERGFVARVECDAPEAFRQRAEALRAHGPLPAIAS